MEVLRNTVIAPKRASDERITLIYGKVRVWLRVFTILITLMLLSEPMHAAERYAAELRYMVSSNGNYRNKSNTLRQCETLEQAIRVIRKQKKKTRGQWYIYDLKNKRQRVWPELDTKQKQVAKAVEWVKAIAQDPSHGYSCYGEKSEDGLNSRWDRWGRYGDYSCSTLIVTAYELCGFADLRKTARKYHLKLLQTGKRGLNSTCLAAALKKSGKFTDITAKVRRGKKLKPGDVLLTTYHVAMYIGKGKIVEASMNELGREYAKTCPGDQTGAEIRICRNYGGWSAYYRPELGD